MTREKDRSKKLRDRIKTVFRKLNGKVAVIRIIGFIAIVALIGVLIYQGLNMNLLSRMGGEGERPSVIMETTLEDYQNRQETVEEDLRPVTKADEGAPDLAEAQTEDAGEAADVAPVSEAFSATDSSDINKGEAEKVQAEDQESGDEDLQEVTEGVKPVAFSVWEILQPLEGEILTPFGWYRHPLLGNWRFHRGIDIKAPLGVPVKAAFSGKVVEVSEDDYYGLKVEIKHNNGFRTVYAQLNEVQVQVGDNAYQGQIIGAVGQTGLATIPHLHFEVIEGNQPVDPLKYLKVKH